MRRKRSRDHATEVKERWRRSSDGGGAPPAPAEERPDGGGGDQAERGDAHPLSEGRSAILCFVPPQTKITNVHHRVYQMFVQETAGQCLFVVCAQDKLQKDQRSAEVNLLKINDQWRTILRQSKGAELRGDVMVLRQMFEGHVDILDNIVEVRSSTASAQEPGSRWLSLFSGLTASLPVCRRWSVSCGRRSVSLLRCDVLTCRIWMNSGLSRRNS